MCIIIIKQKSNTIPSSVLKNSARINPHGLGIVWLDTYDVSYHKSNEYQLLNTDRPFIAHFRLATKGLVNRDNTHPFVCGHNTDELLMMNGTIPSLGDYFVCDTKVLAKKLGNLPRQDWKSKLSEYDCRFVTINTRTRSFQIYNKDLWTYKDGVWYSKTNVLQHNLVAVYGTLKRNHGNYRNYLTSSKYIGSGVTSKKYPLIVHGLPYLIEDEGKGYNVEVDVFGVDDNTLDLLDRLEQHPTWYRRKQVDVIANGKTYNCWIYFNIRETADGRQLHSTYTGANYDWDIATDFEEDTCDEVVQESPMCHCCYNDVVHDGFSNWHCNQCNQWFTEDEILTHFNL